MFKKIVLPSTACRQYCKILSKFHGGYNTNSTQKSYFHNGTCLLTPRNPPKSNKQTSPAIATKYQVITETNSTLIENTADEIYVGDKYPILSDEFDGINLESKFYFSLIKIQIAGGKIAMF